MGKPTIGFIGLGLMGGAMVGRLQDLGYQLTVLGNLDRTYLDVAIGRGATEATTAKIVAQASDVVRPDAGNWRCDRRFASRCDRH